MKRIAQSVLLAGLTALALGACTTNGMRGDTARTSGMTESEYGSTPDVSGGTGAMGGSASGTTGAGAGTAGSASQAGTGSATGTTGATGATGATGSTASGTGSATDQAGQSGITAGTPNSTVTNIEVIPRQSGGAATGAGTVAGAAVGGATSTGTTGGSMTSDRVYRITLRMDDGTVRTITQESTPAFTTGDRVRLSSGAIVR